MVKADIKRNYYTDLELQGDASVEEIKKQYRKLALKYHPDRNPGKEAEIVPKFQAIQAAHEVLQDPVTKAKYDADRRKAGLVPTFGRTPASAARPPPNPYAASAAQWPPPPRRTATTSGPDPNRWRASASAAGPGAGAGAGAGTAGADRFANFPRPAPTSKRAENDKANVFTAWQNMNHAKKKAANAQREAPFQPPRPQPKGAFGTSPQKPRPAAPPRRDTQFPSAEDIRAGTNYRQAPAGGFQSERARTAWAEFTAQNAGAPGMGRSNTTRTPKKSGFDPMAGGDEGQAGSTANYSSSRARTRSDDARTYPPPPPRYPEAPSPFPNPASTAQSQTAAGENDVPYTENIRVKTPYSSHIGQQKYMSSDNLQRNHNSQDPKGGSSVRNTTPQPRQSQNGASQGSRAKPFVVQDSSDDSSTEESSSATTPENAQPGNKSNPELSENPFLRPKRTPIPPSSRTASPLKQPSFDSAPSSAFSASNKADVGDEQTSSAGQSGASEQHPKAQGKNTMYATSPHPSSRYLPLFQQQHSTPTPARSWSQLGSWAIPSTVLPPNHKASALQRDPSILEPSPTWGPTGLPQPVKSRKDLRMKERIPLIDITPRMSYREDLPTMYDGCSPLGGSHSKNHVSNSTCTHGFTFPIDGNTFEPTTTNNMRAKSTENINTKFTPSEWTGTFNANNIFAAPPPSKKPSSPVRKSSRILRQQSNGNLNTQAAANENPFSQYAAPVPESAPSGPPSPPQDPVKFDASEWVKTIKDPSWTFQPDALRSDPAVAGTSRPSSRGTRKPSAKSIKIPTTVPKPATATTIEDEAETGHSTQAEVPGPGQAQPQSQNADSDDLMDIDMEGAPPTASATPFASTATKQKGPKFVKVDHSRSHQKGNKGGSTGPRLDDLAATLPGGSTTGDGLTNLKDISSTLPFESKASDRPPMKSYVPQSLPLPRLPVPPESPTRLSKQAWRSYCEKFARYLAKYHEFDGTMLEHFRSRREKATELVNRGVAELESIGAEKWLGYKVAIDEDERVRAHWHVGANRHEEAVKSFDSVRERVRVLSEGGGLADL